VKISIFADKAKMLFVFFEALLVDVLSGGGL
jgi:hypothetical protein